MHAAGHRTAGAPGQSGSPTAGHAEGRFPPALHCHACCCARCGPRSKWILRWHPGTPPSSAQAKPLVMQVVFKRGCMLLSQIDDRLHLRICQKLGSKSRDIQRCMCSSSVITEHDKEPRVAVLDATCALHSFGWNVDRTRVLHSHTEQLGVSCMTTAARLMLTLHHSIELFSYKQTTRTWPHCIAAVPTSATHALQISSTTVTLGQAFIQAVRRLSSTGHIVSGDPTRQSDDCSLSCSLFSRSADCFLS